MTGYRGTFRPAATPRIPASERGHFEIAPEPGRPGEFRLRLYGDGHRSQPRSILLTLRDVHGFGMFLADVERAAQAVSRIASKAARP